jgi:catechol 2,3-dioxygenase-like lactoylglutathione lyase family enzyme
MSVTEPAPTVGKGFIKFSALYLPSSDIAASRAFYVDVLRADLISSDATSFRVRVGDFDIVVARQDGGGTPAGAEYPHYALTVTPEQYVGLKGRLDGYGVPTNQPWTRKGAAYALMYFRDPSGNQYELYSPEGGGSLPLRIGARAGGDYRIDFDALSYRNLTPPADRSALPAVRATGFNHMTVPVRDLAEGKRFFLEVVGSPLLFESRTHVQVVFGGAELGMAGQDRGYTAPDARFPRRRYTVDAVALRELKTRLESFGVPTHEPATSDGTDALMYFRDPSGNLFELFCPEPDADLRNAAAGRFEPAVDVRALMA